MPALPHADSGPAGRHRRIPGQHRGLPAGQHRAEAASRRWSTPVLLGAASLVLAGSGTVTGGAAGAAGGPVDPTEVPFGTVELAAGVQAAAAPVTRLPDPGSLAPGRTRVAEASRRLAAERISRSTERADLDVQQERRAERLARKAERQARERAAAIRNLTEAARTQAEELAADEWVLPLRRYQNSAGYGEAGYLWSSGYHTGIDFSAPDGTPISSVTGGVVITAGYSAKASWAGNVVVVKLEPGTTVWYAHQSSVAVSVGDAVSPGQLLGHVGSTGNSTGSHLHLEVQVRGKPVDPGPMLARHGLNP